MGEASHHATEAAGGPDSRRSSWPGWRGRAREWGLVVGSIKAARAGRGGVLLVEGPSGAGKSHLLGLAAAAAERSGLGVARGVADELTQLIPLAPLLSALGESDRTLFPGRNASVPGPADQRLQLLQELQEPLERLVADGPVLLTLDDVEWADPLTLLALRSMTSDLSSYPLVWMLARTIGRGDAPRLDCLFNVLEKEGATRLELAALDEPAVADVVTDVLGAAPEPDVLALASLAKGNPFLLVDLLEQLNSEGAFQVADGHVHMVSAGLPRVQAVTQERLAQLPVRTRHLLQAAAVLGRSFSVTDLAEMVGESTSGLLSMLEEAMAAGIVEATERELAFRHDLLWQAVVGTLPAAVRRALHHDAAEMLLRRGGSAVPAAAHLLHSAGRGDESALLGLDRAAREVLRSSPQTAADLATRALELSDPADPGWAGRAATAVDALTTIGRLPEAADLARTALGRAPPAQAPHLRCALAYILLLSGRPAEAESEAESLLAQDIPEDLRGIAEWTVFWGLICLNDFGRGRLRAEAVLADRARHTDAAVVGALLLLARLAMVDGRIADSFAHLHEAQRIANSGTVEAIQRPYARLLLSLNYRAMRQFGPSEIAIQDAEEEINALGLTVLAAGPALFRSVLRLAAGRFDDAAAEAKAGMMIADELGTHGFIRVGLSMLAFIAMRRGDIDTAVRHIERYHSINAASGMLFGSVWERWVMAAVAEAQGDPERAIDILHAIYTDQEERRWALTTTPLTASWMTRLALATGNRPYARAIVDTAESLARNNPDFPCLAVTAAHARGLLRQDPGALASAVTDQPEPWARASAAEDLGVLLAARPGTAAREQAVNSLDQALDGYQHVGALRDAARVRARLRALGVRRRHWAQPPRPSFGWDGLTDTEREVAVLVAQGLTNRQAAARMFLSPHTVSTHLRRIFTKLDIGSRVDLARIVTERCPDALRDA
ncbi:helix-turn-helix transcriptional regulator [Nonomuraea sp. KM90]|uniref:helix-turn-helix transcriptional regulator n=1 Tax=Nonomuraea sp. KM90 TaxID=3457428 RepID=UPI003FCEAEE6